MRRQQNKFSDRIGTGGNVALNGKDDGGELGKTVEDAADDVDDDDAVPVVVDDDDDARTDDRYA